MSITKILLSVVAVSAITACSTTVVPVSSEPSKNPPRLVSKNGVVVWDQSEGFARVPPTHEARGAQLCGPSRHAQGFHPKAQDLNGNTFPNGGYLCLPR